MGLQDLASPAIIGSFFAALEDEYQKSWASRVGWLNPNSNQEIETYKWLGNVPKFREWIGGRDASHPKVDGISIRNKLWEQTLEFLNDDLRRDKTGQINARIGQLAQSGAAFWEDLLTALINNGNSSGFTAYDGELYFDTDHPVLESTAGSTTAKNLISSTEVPALDVGTATAPTVVEAANIIQGIIGHFQTFKTDQGHLMNSQARGFLFMVGTPAVWGPFQSARSMMFLTSGQSNPLSGLQAEGYQIDVIMNPNLTTATDKVYAFRTDGVLKPFILQDEYGTKVQVLGADSEESFKNRRQLFGTDRSGNAGYGLWQQAVKATMS